MALSERAALAPFREASFRVLFSGRVVNFFGNAFAPVALGFAVLDATGSTARLGLVVGVRMVANVVFLLFGGVLADRLPRAAVLVGSNVLSGLSQIALAALVLTHHTSLPLLLVLSAFNGTVSALSNPASAALTSQTIPDALRTQANAVMRLGRSGAMILGSSCAGILVAGFGAGWGLAVDGATFLASAALFAALRVPSAAPAERASTITELRQGWTEFASRTWVWLVVVAFMIVNAVFSSAQQVLGPAVADHTFGRRAWGFIIAAQTAGMVVGGMLAIRLRPRRLLLFGCVCVLGQVPLLLALGVWPMVPVLLVAGFVDGLLLEQFGVAWEVSLQQHIPADRLARVYSYDMVGSFVAIPIGQMSIGPLAEAYGNGPVLVGGAALSVAMVAMMCASRSVRGLVNEARAPEADAEAVAVTGAA
ncbi:hypothetical protein BIV57_06285 [Mangrovactinospora gilvigrisea]|uniref:Major facilitator superfamily (MFS) profile domain-containing protein n=1 Tax=Mangrovactinospora gilvigrisea TaxID=1428644 RepID=A0A1J7CEZ6_9ACTN|nr:MFS transporter [Mangrovactinospora gilvigrisea]OIV38274.1 hypothetical protein BIV57_06285 [Mangrovactinospora gilvigrisea]